MGAGSKPSAVGVGTAKGLTPVSAGLRAAKALCVCVLVLVQNQPQAQRTDAHHEVKSCTAFFLSEQGILLTSAHVVSRCSSISVWPPDSPGVPAKLIAVDRQLDIAVLSEINAVQPYGKGPALGKAVVDEPVSIISFGVHPSAPRLPEFVDGTVMNGAAPRNMSLITISAPVQPGASGAPVVNGRGDLLGVIIGRSAATDGIAVAVSSDAIAAFLHARGIAISARPSSMVGPADPRSALRQMALLVQCAPANQPDSESSH